MSALDDYYDELERLVAAYLATLGNPTRHYLNHMVPNATAEAVSNMLCIDALGEFLLTDEQVGHLWALGYAEGYDATQLVPDAILAKARPERRIRPPQPVRFPLKGGGHGPGRGIPGKAEFPSRWSDDDVLEHVMSVAMQPDGAVQQPDGTFRAWGVRDGIDLRVIVTELGHVQSSYPVAGSGVMINELDDLRRPYVERLQRLVDEAPLDDEARAGAAELMTAGEWDQVLLHLRAVTSGEELDALAEAAGL